MYAETILLNTETSPYPAG